MKVVGVQIDNSRLPLGDMQVNTTTCYKVFMNYCIENYPPDILLATPLNKYFKQGSLNPEFKRGIVYNRVVGHNFIFYSTYNSTYTKIKRMHFIADNLGIQLHLLDDRGLFV